MVRRICARMISVLALVLPCATGVNGQELQPCAGLEAELRAECGTVTVLEDRTKLDGRTIDLYVIVLRAEKPDGRAPLFLLAGGPGQGATDLMPLVLGPYAPVRTFRDVVLVDQRGTGKSNPLDCPSHSDEDPQEAFGSLFDLAWVAECSQRHSQRADLRLYGTLHVVEDLEEVRQQLGYEKVVLWGGSGGTRTALVWLREHPDRVEAVVLDGVVSTDFRAPSGYARGCQDALEKVYADCDAQATCHAAYPQLRQEFAALLQRFDAGAVETFVTREDGVKIPVRMSKGDFGYAVRGILYRSELIAELPKMIHESAAAGDMSQFAQLLWLRDIGIRPLLAEGVHFSVFATEDVPFIDEKDVPALTEGTFLGTYLIDRYRAACKAWGGRGALPANFQAPVRAEVPVLLLSGYYDPSTPPEAAAAVAQYLPHSRHVIVRNEAHGAGFGCARQLVVDFLKSGSLEGLGPACDDVGPIVFDVLEEDEE